MTEKIYFLLFFCIASIYSLNAQLIDSENRNSPFTCDVEHLTNFQDEAYQMRAAALELDYQRFVERSNNNQRTMAFLPVIVHIVHNNGTENISDAQVNQAITFLNQSYENTGFYDQGTGTAVPIQFCLARQDPDGNATSGITRTVSGLTNLNSATDDPALKALIQWDPLSYINIYIVRQICRGTECGVAGYAYLPPSHGRPEDGIVMEASFFGSSASNNSVLTHEMGHYLGLDHTFNGGCTNNDCLADGDRVCDTPPDGTTSPAPCPIPPNSCTTDEDDTSMNNPFRSVALGGLGDQPDMHINYMDYGDLNCYSAFTPGQAMRMEFFMRGARASLLNSNACEDSCPNPMTATILESNSTINLGDNFSFNGQVTNASTQYWTINAVLESNALSFNYNFNTEGVFEVVLFAESNDPLCRAVTDTIWIEVVCPTEASFSPAPVDCQPLNTTVTLQNTSINFTSIQWIRDGGVLSGNNSVDIVFSSGGRHEIILVATNGICSDTFSHTFSVGCNEICDNGYDDDDDGLVDYYDDDCCAEPSSFQFLCDDECKDLHDFPYNFGVKWESDLQSSGFTAPAMGDVDGDGNVEVVARMRDSSIVVMDGATGTTKYFFRAPVSIDLYISIADLDNDGFGEILAISRQGFLYCFDYTGVVKFVGDTRVTDNGPPSGFFSFNMFTSIADFDQDGLPEIVVGNKIYNGQTGALIATGGIGSKGVGQFLTGAWQKWLTVAADILPDGFCTDCQGLELIAGNQIYAVDVVNGNITPAINAQLPKDGFTGVADFDLDGDLDVIVLLSEVTFSPPASHATVYVWDGQTNSILGEFMYMDTTGNTSSQMGGMVVGNMDDDDELEVAFKYASELVLMDNDFTLAWEAPLKDGSAVAPIGFDFNGDGIIEVVHRDDTLLRIFDGPTGAMIYFLQARSATVCEYLGIADIDNDGAAEIVFDGNGNYRSIGILSGPKWSGARPVFNQAQYFNVNINDDLTVPPEQQKHHLVGDLKIMNNFNVPLAIPRLLVNGELDVVDVDCLADSIYFEIEVCNVDFQTIPANMPISIYCGDPASAGASLMNVVALNQEIEQDSCITIQVAISNACLGPFYTVLNDDGSNAPPFDVLAEFPITSILECDYLNNLDTSSLPDFVPTIDLGNDTIICTGAQIILSTADTFDQYLWDDGSMDATRVVMDAGWYWLEVNSPCFGTVRDSIFIDSLQSDGIDLGPDTAVCANSLVALSLSGQFTDYRWSTLESTPTITVWQPGTYAVTVTNACGQEVDDEIVISMLVPGDLNIGNDTTICAGDSVELSLPSGQSYAWGPEPDINCMDCQQSVVFPSQTTSYVAHLTDVNGCVLSDTLVVFVDTSFVFRDTAFYCSGDSVLIENTWIKEPGEYRFMRPQLMGCDSIFIYTVDSIVPVELYDSLGICLGDSILIESTWITSPGDYTFVRPGTMSFCDSVLYLFVELVNNYEIFDTLQLCEGDTVVIQGMNLVAPGQITYTNTSTTSCDTVFFITAELLPNIETLDTINGCAGDSIFLDGNWISENDTVILTHTSSQGCDSVVEIHVIFEHAMFDMTNDTTIVSASPVQIQISGDTQLIEQVEWSPIDDLVEINETTVVASPVATTMYTATIETKAGCLYSEQILIEVLGSSNFYIPSAFSPDDNAINDQFLMYGESGVEQFYDLKIFNRWGGKVYDIQNARVNNQTDGWDGHANGKALNPGLYVYTIELIENGILTTYKGNIHLIK